MNRSRMVQEYLKSGGVESGATQAGDKCSSFAVTQFREKEVQMSIPRHCPGFEQFKGLKSFVCKCPNCGKEVEIFSDEFDKKHTCKGCYQEIDFTKCALTGGASNSSPR